MLLNDVIYYATKTSAGRWPDLDADLSSRLRNTFWEVENKLLFATLEMHDGDKTAAADTGY